MQTMRMFIAVNKICIYQQTYLYSQRQAKRTHMHLLVFGVVRPMYSNLDTNNLFKLESLLRLC